MNYAEYFSDSAEALTACAGLMEVLTKAECLMWESLESGGKIIWCGNGGSASDAQHLAAELVGRFAKNRRAMASISLSTDTSVLTALANDFGFDTVFERQIEAIGNPNDILIGISTSGKSNNVLLALVAAKKINMKTIALIGNKASPMTELADITIAAPSEITSHIQECHISIGQALCGALEDRIRN